MISLNRREFIKLAAATGAIAALYGTNEYVFRTLKAASPVSEEKYVNSICTMCVNRCAIKVKVVNGRAVKIYGNPKDPHSLGKICARGQSGIERLYSPHRIKSPMIRTDKGKRGTWEGFQEVSWDEALEYVANVLRKRKEEDPKTFACGGGWLPCALYKPFVVGIGKMIGSPNGLGSPPPMCFFPKAFAWTITIGAGGHPHIRADHENARYIILLRRNLAGSLGVPYATTFAMAKKRGAKIVVLDPRLSESAAIADVWVPLRPGTDLAFLLAMGHVILKRGLYDSAFLKKYTNAPMLLDANTGKPVKVWDDEESGKKKYLVYDSYQARAVPHDEAADPALTGEYDVQLEDGSAVRAKPVFQALMERLEEYTPEWAAEICDVPADLIERVAVEFGTYKPSVIDPGWHDPKYENSVQTWRMAAILNALVGNIDKPGGLIFNAAGRSVKSKPLPDARFDVQWSKKKGIIVNNAQANVLALYDAVVHGDPYPIKSLMLGGGNWIRTLPDDRKVKEIFMKLEDVIVIDNMPTDTAMYADVILPDTTYLERDDPLFGVGFTPDAAVYTAYKAVEPLYDAKPMIDILVGIADKLGMREAYFKAVAAIMGFKDYKKLMEGYENEGIAGLRRVLAEAKGVPIDALERDGVVLKVPREKLIGTMPYKKPLNTPSGKVELFSLKLAAITATAGKNPVWSPLPEWVPPRVFNKAEGNVFYLTYGRSPITSHTHTSDNELLLSIKRKAHYGVWINAKRASELGIKDGDLVRLTSLQSGNSAVAVAFVTEGVRPDTIFTVSGWGQESEKLAFAREVRGVAVNKLWAQFEEPFKLLPNALTQEILVRVEKA